MRKIIYSMLMSLDGFIARPNGELDWALVDEELHTFFNERERDVDTHLYGRRMYEIMVDFWPTADDDPAAPAFVADYARIWKDMPKVVFSTSLEHVAWNSRLVRGDISGEVATLKAQPGKDLGLGGANLAETFMRLGLIDAFHVYLNPVVLGRGTPMFPISDDTVRLRLVETRTFSSGVVYLHYHREGPAR